MACEQQRLTCILVNIVASAREVLLPPCRLEHAASYNIGRHVHGSPTSDTIWEERAVEVARRVARYACT
eukprot:360202-Chlamydomonas_euryale.AAC.8